MRDDEAAATRRPAALKPLEQPDAVVERPERALRDQALEQRLLDRRVVRRAGAVRIGDAEVVEHRARAVLARAAGDVRGVDGVVERAGPPARARGDVGELALHELVQRLAPGALVRRVDEHAVDVEDGTAQRRRGSGTSAMARTGYAARRPPTRRIGRAAPGPFP